MSIDPPAVPRKSRRPSRTWLILLAVVLGFIFGLILRRTGGAHSITAFLGPVGELWLNGLRMTLIPLVFCLIATGFATLARSTSSGRFLAVTLAVFAALLLAFACVGTAATYAFLSIWPVHAGAAALATNASSAAAPQSQSLVEQVISLIPVNPIAAAAQGAITPLILFAAIFGTAIASLTAARGNLLLEVLQALGAAMLQVIEWVLRLAPIGVFALAATAAATAGAGIAAGLAQYVALLCAIMGVGLVCAILLGVFSGFSGVGPKRFLQAATAPQALAISTQSSMACLPALVIAAQRLQIPEAVIDSILPLAVSTFRVGNVFIAVPSAIVGAKLFGITPTAGQVALAILVSILTNIGTVGVPGQAVLFAAFGPVFAVVGAPLEALTLLVAVFTLPDMLITTTNVDLAVTSWIARLASRTIAPLSHPTIRSPKASANR
jgi:proton glutamate symport protein